jgi:hypothetical protein
VQTEPAGHAARSADEPAQTSREANPEARPTPQHASTSQAPAERPGEASPAVPAPVEPVAAVPQVDELTVPADAGIGLRIEQGVSSETARIEDRVDARVIREVRVAGRTAIPVGARLEGSVVRVDTGGRFTQKARLDVRFHTLVLADGTRVPLRTEPLVREGDSPTRDSALKVGGSAAAGAILGAILGGGKGAAIGGAVGAAGGTTAVMASGRNAAMLAAGSTVTVRLTSPVSVTLHGEQDPSLSSASIR